jgi:hypothetical protein
MNENTLHTVIGIALLVFLILPLVIGALRERRIDRQLRAAERGLAHSGTGSRRSRTAAQMTATTPREKGRKAAPALRPCAPNCTAEA